MHRGNISLVQAQFSCYSMSECHKCDWKWLEMWCNDTSTSHWFTVGVRRNNKTGLVEALSDCSGKRLGTKGIFWISVWSTLACQSRRVWGACPPQENFQNLMFINHILMHFEFLNVNLFITIYQIFINVSTDFCTILHGYYYEDRLLTVFTPKLCFRNNLNLGWLSSCNKIYCSTHLIRTMCFITDTSYLARRSNIKENTSASMGNLISSMWQCEVLLLAIHRAYLES